MSGSYRRRESLEAVRNAEPHQTRLRIGPRWTARSGTAARSAGTNGSGFRHRYDGRYGASDRPAHSAPARHDDSVGKVDLQAAAVADACRTRGGDDVDARGVNVI